MPDDTNATVLALGRLTVPELKQRYAEVFGEPTRTNHKQYLVKRIVWRMQALREGGLSERARRRALELADDAEIHLTAPFRRAHIVLTQRAMETAAPHFAARAGLELGFNGGGGKSAWSSWSGT